MNIFLISLRKSFVGRSLIESYCGKCYIIERSCHVDISDVDLGGLFIEVIPSSVGQFTGLTDKNGKEIFEGDTYRLGSFNHKIVFDNGAFCATRISNYNPTPINWTPLDDDDCISVQFASSHIDITGNIHEK